MIRIEDANNIFIYRAFYIKLKTIDVLEVIDRLASGLMIGFQRW